MLSRKMAISHTFNPRDIYTIFSIEPHQNLHHLGVSVLLKPCLVTHFASSTLLSHYTGQETGKHRFTSLSTPLLYVCNSLLTVIGKKNAATGLHVYFLKKESSSHLNGLFLKDGITGVLEGKMIVTRYSHSWRHFFIVAQVMTKDLPSLQ